MKTVSVIIIVYNDARFIERAILSALNQTYNALEIIVIDDGSTDSSLAIAKSFEKKGVRVFSKTNGGAASARNLGAKQASGKYLAFLDSDDVWVPQRVEKMMCACDSAQDPCLVFSGYFFVNEKLKPIMKPFIARSSNPYQEVLRCKNQMIPSTMIIHRKIFDTLNGFSEEPKVRGYEDAVFTLLATQQFQSIPVAEPLTLYLYSDSGQGRVAVYNYEESLSRQKAVLNEVQPFLNNSDFTLFQKSAWQSTFCKFAMYGQLKSARRLKKEMQIRTIDLLFSIRGGLALFSAYSRINLLLTCKNGLQAVYKMFARSIPL